MIVTSNKRISVQSLIEYNAKFWNSKMKEIIYFSYEQVLVEAL